MKAYENLFLLFLLGLVLLFNACQKDESSENAEESIVYIQMREMRSEDNERQLILVLKTAKFYPCSNYPLLASYSFTDSRMQAEVNQADIPEICLSGFNPATAIFFLYSPNCISKIHLLDRD